MEFRSSGDTALTVQLGTEISPEINAHVVALRAAIDAAKLPGVIETVPTYVSVLVHYDPLLTDQAELLDAIKLLAGLSGETNAAEQRSWLLPVCFDGADFAPDLSHVAQWAGVTSDEVVSDLIDAEQIVYMIGFAPGQPYLGDLPERLAIPRKENPVSGVPRGAVVTATGKTVIYSQQNPTGWHVVGRTPVPLFDLTRPKPVLLAAGDKVRFRRVEEREFSEIAAAIADDSYDVQREASS